MGRHKDYARHAWGKALPLGRFALAEYLVVGVIAAWFSANKQTKVNWWLVALSGLAAGMAVWLLHFTAHYWNAPYHVGVEDRSVLEGAYGRVVAERDSLKRAQRSLAQSAVVRRAPSTATNADLRALAIGQARRLRNLYQDYESEMQPLEKGQPFAVGVSGGTLLDDAVARAQMRAKVVERTKSLYERGFHKDIMAVRDDVWERLSINPSSEAPASSLGDPLGSLAFRAAQLPEMADELERLAASLPSGSLVQSKKATLRVSLVSKMGSRAIPSYDLVVSNDGPGTAENLVVKIGRIDSSKVGATFVQDLPHRVGLPLESSFPSAVFATPEDRRVNEGEDEHFPLFAWWDSDDRVVVHGINGIQSSFESYDHRHYFIDDNEEVAVHLRVSAANAVGRDIVVVIGRTGKQVTARIHDARPMPSSFRIAAPLRLESAS